MFSLNHVELGNAVFELCGGTAQPVYPGSSCVTGKGTRKKLYGAGWWFVCLYP